MKKHQLSLTQGCFILSLIITGSSFIVGVNNRARQDAWASLLIGCGMMLLISLVYVRIVSLYPDTNGFFNTIDNITGKALGKVITLLYAFYALQLASAIIRNFTEFIKIVLMPETPQLPLMLVFLVVSSYLVRSGYNILGKWAMVTFPIVLFMVTITVLFSFNIFDSRFLYPVLDNPPSSIFFGAFEILSFPLAETILFVDLLYNIKKGTNPYKMYLYGLSLGSLLLLIVMVRNILVLGPDVIAISYFPSYSAAKAIETGKILQRIEGTITINFVLGGITKISVALLFAAKAVGHLLNLRSHKNLIIPCALITLALAVNAFGSTVEMFDFINIYDIYAFPFQIFFPFLLWIIAEVKNRRSQKQNKTKAT
jgi:spore germination protein KB